MHHIWNNCQLPKKVTFVTTITSVIATYLRNLKDISPRYDTLIKDRARITPMLIDEKIPGSDCVKTKYANVRKGLRVCLYITFSNSTLHITYHIQYKHHTHVRPLTIQL